MVDLVQRLRAAPANKISWNAPVIQQAADEIERLRAGRSELMRGYQNFVNDSGKRERRLRAALEFYAKMGESKSMSMRLFTQDAGKRAIEALRGTTANEEKP